MKKTMWLAGLMAGAMIAAPAMAASADFEGGMLDGFAASGDTGTTSMLGSYNAYQGKFFAYLYAGLGTGVYSTLTRSFTLKAGQTLAGHVGFEAQDYLPYDDDAYLSVNGTNLFAASVGTVGDYGASGWRGFSFTAPTAGTYTLQLGVRNNLDNGFSSFAVLDDVSTSAVPEPATWAMMLAGFGAVGFALRRRAKVRTAVSFA